MWILDLLVNGRNSRFFLVAGSYTIGRGTDCAIVVTDGDSSISRVHCSVHVLPVVSSAMTGSQDSLKHCPAMIITDSSKHGTWLDNTRIEPHEIDRKARSGSVLRLGTKIRVQLQYTPLIVALSSTLNTFDQRAMELLVGRLGGVVREPIAQEEVRQRNIPAMGFFFVTNEVSGNEESAMLAMLYGYTLIAPPYLELLSDVVRGTPSLPIGRWPQPRTFDAMRSRELADRVYFRPEPSFFEGGAFLYDTVAKTTTNLFRTCCFLFLSGELSRRYQHVLRSGGGKMVLRDPEAVLHWQAPRTDDGMPPLLLPGLIDNEDCQGLQTFVVLSANDYTTLLDLVTQRSREGRDALRRDEENALLRAYLKLWEDGLVLIDEENLHAAIYTNDPAGQLRTDAPGVLQRAGMGELSEDDADSNATEEGIRPFVPRGGRLLLGSSSSASLRVKVCEPQQLLHTRKQSPSRPNWREEGDRSADGDTVMISNETPGLSAQLYRGWQQSLSQPLPHRGAPTPTQRATGGSPVRTVSPVRRGSAVMVAPNATSIATPTLRRVASSPTRLMSSTASVCTSQATQPPSSSPTRRTTISPFRRPLPSSLAPQTNPDAQLFRTCTHFLQTSLPPLAAAVMNDCQHVADVGYMDGDSRRRLEDASTEVQRFVDMLSQSESSLEATGAGRKLSTETRRLMYDIRQRAETIFRAIRAVNQTIGLPPWGLLTSPLRAVRSPMRSRPSSPTRTMHRSPVR